MLLSRRTKKEFAVITALIVDDEVSSRRLLKEALDATGKVELLGEADNGQQGLQLIETLHPQIVFLDIQMGELSGLEVARILLEQEQPPLIVFITAYNAYAVDAFELAATDYIVKGLEWDDFAQRLSKTVDRLDQRLASAEAPELASIREALDKLTQRQVAPVTQKLPVKDYDEGTVRLIDPEKVISIERKDRRVVLRTVEREYPTYFTIERLEQRLAGTRFFRANPGALINLDYVEHLIPNGDGTYDVLLADTRGDVDGSITVSRSRSKALFELLNL
jgi:DNA-binding LytR/AlgR family response regulator